MKEAIWIVVYLTGVVVAYVYFRKFDQQLTESLDIDPSPPWAWTFIGLAATSWCGVFVLLLGTFLGGER